METAIRHTHLLSVVLFLVLYLVKTFLLVSNNKEGLAKMTKITKVPEMIISVLFLGTGIYLVTQVGATMLIMIKIVMVLVSIPLAIIGFKKENKALAIIALLLIIGAYGLAEVNKKKAMKQNIDAGVSDINAKNYDINAHGKEVYQAYCERCHGKEGVGGAMGLNLATTTFDKEAKIERIQNGAGSMPGFKDVLSDGELNAVVSFIETFHQ